MTRRKKQDRIRLQRHIGPLARDFMGKRVITAYQDTNVGRAIRVMDEHNIGSVVVLDSLGPCGAFTERDLLSRVLARGKDPEATVLAEVTSPKYPSISPPTSLEDTALAMITKKSRLMVIDGADLVGIVTPTDLVKVLKNVEKDFSILRVISTHTVAVLPDSR